MKNRKVKLFGYGIILALMCGGHGLGAATDRAEQQQSKEVLTNMQKRMQKIISVDFRNTPIDDVLRTLADQGQIDIIKSPEVQGEVTASITDVPLTEALDNILSVHNYGYIASDNMIRIIPKAQIELEKTKLVNRIYRVTYADAREVEAALKKFISKKGSLSCNPGTSNIIVTDIERNIKAIDTFIDEIDRITPQVLVEVRIYDITTNEGFDLGIDWFAGRNAPLKTTTNERKHERINTIVSPTNVTETTSTDTLVYNDDGAGGRVIDTDETTYETETVTKLIPKTQGYAIEDINKSIETFTERRRKPFISGNFSPEFGGSINLGLLNNAIEIDIILTALHSQLSAKLLANPRIMVLDNETAVFKIVREIPYKEETSTSAGGFLTSTEFKEVGVELQVTPHVTRDGMLRLQITPEFGVAEQQKFDSTGQPLVPTVNTRKLDTIALVMNNQTVVLGGLRKKEITKDIRKVPLLGDIPLIGELFKSTTESEVTNELLIFITPRIIIEPKLSPIEAARLQSTKIITSENPTLVLEQMKQIK